MQTTWTDLVNQAISRGCDNAGEFILGMALAHRRPNAEAVAEIMRVYGQHRQTEQADEPAENVILPYPPSVNRAWRNYRGRMVLSSEAKDYKTTVGWKCRELGLNPVTGDLAITIDVYRPRKAGDLDNASKLILDSLQGHMYKNDKQIVELHMRRHDDKKNPRVEVSIRRAS